MENMRLWQWNEQLGEAGIDKKDVDYINAHGTSTDLNDKYETAAIKKVLAKTLMYLFLHLNLK